MKIIKRNEIIEKYDKSKIAAAISNAIYENNLTNDEIYEVVDFVTDLNYENSATTVHVDVVNNNIEMALMKFEHYNIAKNFILYREKHKEQRQNKKDNEAIQDFIFMDRYSRYLPRKKRRETWDEAVDRVMNMHIKKYPQVENEIVEAFGYVRRKEVLPSMRSLQFAGPAIEKKNYKLYNCSYSPCDRIEFFKEIIFLLLCGCGAGASIEFENINKLPKLANELDETNIKHFVIPDTIEGWAESVDELFQSYLKGYIVEFIYKKIRPKGSKVGGVTGAAPGHIPLKKSLEKIRTILHKSIGRKLKPIECYDIIMHECDAVLAGGIRRCLPKEYDIKMADGSYKNITDVKVGDEIIFQNKTYPIDNIFDNGVQELMKIKTENGYHISTPNHKWLVLNAKTKTQVWKQAKQIQQDPHNFYFVKDDANETLKIVEVINIDKQQTYDIEVREVHAFTAKHSISKTESISHNSATIMLFSEDDHEMMSAKTGEWFKNNPQRGRSNNSVKLLRSSTDLSKFKRIFDNIKDCGEPGFYFVDDMKAGTNPCLTGDTLIETDKGMFTIKYICENIQNNYKALSYNLNSKMLEFKTITNGALTRKNSEVIQLVIDETCHINVTPDHEIFTVENGYVKAKKLNDHSLLDNHLNIKKIEFEQIIPKQDVFDITVEDNHNFFANNILVSNCCEIGIYPYLKENNEFKSGWGFCNLTTVNGAKLTSLEKFKELVKAATIIGTLQAGYTDLPFLGETSELLAKQDALLGVSITGIMDNPDITLNYDNQKNVAQYAVEINKQFADKININPAPRITCIKPEGCFVPDQTIKTSTGIKSFEEIFNENGYSLNDIKHYKKQFLDVKTNIKILNENNEEETISKLFVNGINDMVEIKCDDGSSMKCTPWHQFKIDGEWKRADELKNTKINEMKVLSVNKIENQFSVDIETNSTHTYQLSNGAIVHNSSSILLNTASGIHPRYAKKYFRRIQCNTNNPIYQHFKKDNPHCCEKSIWSPNGTDDVIKFCIDSPKSSICKNDLTALQFIEIVKQTQINWVKHGVNKEHPRYDENLNHNVSNTVSINPDEWNDIMNYIFDNKELFTGVSLLGNDSAMLLKQAPHQEVLNQSDELEWDKIVNDFKFVNYVELNEDEDNTKLQETVACAGGACEIK